MGWQLVEHVIDEVLKIELPNPTVNIQTDNQDSFQGPIEDIDLGSNRPEPNPGTAALELSDDLCLDPNNMQILLDAGVLNNLAASSNTNQAQIQRMIKTHPQRRRFICSI